MNRFFLYFIVFERQILQPKTVVVSVHSRRYVSRSVGNDAMINRFPRAFSSPPLCVYCCCCCHVSCKYVRRKIIVFRQQQKKKKKSQKPWKRRKRRVSYPAARTAGNNRVYGSLSVVPFVNDIILLYRAMPEGVGNNYLRLCIMTRTVIVPGMR